MQHVFVHITPTDPENVEVHHEDEDVPGVYKVSINDGVDADMLLHVAGKGFHEYQPISVLDSFDIVVKDAQGKPLESSIDFDDVDTQDLAFQVTGVLKTEGSGAPRELIHMREAMKRISFLPHKI